MRRESGAVDRQTDKVVADGVGYTLLYSGESVCANVHGGIRKFCFAGISGVREDEKTGDRMMDATNDGVYSWNEAA